MTKDKFYNETYETTLIMIVYDGSITKECEELDNYLIKKGMDKSVVYDNINNSKAFCTNFWDAVVICFDSNHFKAYKGKNKQIEGLRTLSHECGHFRGHVLRNISETVTTTDSEVYTRISDWAFKKCMSVKYFKKFLKKQK